ncbi:tRNA(Met) cytidine acetyltransferase TmcA [Billgrantia endophytica]|nr:GNAT family N-acetyltransferase [Halomonas endophytica]
MCPDSLERTRWLSSAKARIRLGGEHDLVVLDAVSEGAEFDPDVFGALSGTLRAGGLLVLLTPPDWKRPAAASPYLMRLHRRLEGAGGVVRWPVDSGPAFPEYLLTVAERTPAPSEDPDCLTADQAEAVARLVKLKRRRPLVLTADRGRGKTSALGIACARLLLAGERRILVTAPRPAAVSALFERLERLCPSGRRQDNSFIEANGARVDFMAPDELSTLVERGEAGGAGCRLLVDEAAAIPAALLGQWLERFPRLAFATTVHGYEGSGRGFALRFRERLERQAPDWREFHLAMPIRWAEGDPLERLVNDLLLLDAEPPPASAPGGLDMWRWCRHALAAEEEQLRAVFGLLVQAHYRTSPADLRRLLDEPGLRVATLASRKQTQAVMLCGEEGGFDAGLAEQVARGERRPQGHLLAQSLAAHAGSRDALMARLRRVQRIAVHPGRRREGLGRRLLQAELVDARRAGVDLVGASFGAEPGLIAFWQAQGFRAVRLGLSRETATGEHAVMMVAPVSDRGEALAGELTAGFQQLLPMLLAFELNTLDPMVALALLAEGPRPPLNDLDRRDIADVAFGFREPALARPALRALVRCAAAEGKRDRVLSLMLAWGFQGRDMAWLASRLGVSGRREVVAWLRREVAVLLEGYDLRS